MDNVNKHTRAGDHGKKIQCPLCGVPKSKPMNGKAAKEAWLAGYKVFWKSEIYTVFQDSIGQWLNECTVNGHCVGVGDTEGGYYTHGKRS